MKLTKETAVKVAKAVWTHKAGRAATTAGAVFLLGLLGMKIAPEAVHGFVDLALVVAAVL